MRDLFERTKAELELQEKDWLRSEVADCLKNAESLAARLADTISRHGREMISEVESRYATLVRMTSVPGVTRGMTIKSKQEFTGRMERLRQLVLRLRSVRDSAAIRPC